MTAIQAKYSGLADFGFRYGRGGTHTSRTMMFDELVALLNYVDGANTSQVDYQRAVEIENCLGKRSAKTRQLTYRHLAELYSLDTAHILFRALLYFWQRDKTGRPILALLCAYARDAVLRASAPLILRAPLRAVVTRGSMEEHIDAQEPGRFSPATLKSTAQNINSTWTKSGHLHGRVKKVRGRTAATPGGVAYALLLSYLTGVRGTELFRSEYMQLLDCSFEQLIDAAHIAASRGWITFKRVENVIEVLFPNLINQSEQEWLREQN